MGSYCFFADRPVGQYKKSDIPEINPSIWFEDNNGNNCWLIIRCAKYSDNKIKLMQKT